VELVDDDYTLAGRAYTLLQVADIDPAKRIVTLAVPKNVTPYVVSDARHPFLRRWDQHDDVGAAGVVAVVEGKAIDLECGIQIAFDAGGLYATGDYWVIPARVAGNGSIDWPLDPEPPDADMRGVARRASGVHHVAVLGGVDSDHVYRECCCRHVPLCLAHAAAFDPIVDAIAAPQPATRPAGRAPAKKPAKKKPAAGGSR
jgi:hypothetical protein